MTPHYPSAAELAAMREEIARHRHTPIDDVRRAGYLVNDWPAGRDVSSPAVVSLDRIDLERAHGCPVRWYRR